MPFYPEPIAKKIESSVSDRKNIADASGRGTGLALECGSIVRFAIRVDGQSVKDTTFTSNGCGYAVAVTSVLAEWLSGKQLEDLHGLADDEMHDLLDRALGTTNVDRLHCRRAAIDSARAALADLRERRVSEFKGDEALVCTCFGVGENVILDLVRGHHAATVEDVGRLCRAGTGCGACRLVIEEIISSSIAERAAS